MIFCADELFLAFRVVLVFRTYRGYHRLRVTLHLLYELRLDYHMRLCNQRPSKVTAAVPTSRRLNRREHFHIVVKVNKHRIAVRSTCNRVFDLLNDCFLELVSKFAANSQLVDVLHNSFWGVTFALAYNLGALRIAGNFPALIRIRTVTPTPQNLISLHCRLELMINSSLP